VAKSLFSYFRKIPGRTQKSHVQAIELSVKRPLNTSLGKKVKQMIYIAVLCNSEITAEPLYNTSLFIGPYAAANNTALLA